MGKFDINPFDRSALTEYRLLAGRSSEYRRIRFILRNSSLQRDRIKSILITGDRGVGKTSFLNLIEKESLANNLIPVRINLTEANSVNSNEFFWYVFYQIINKLFDLNLLGGKGGLFDAMIQKILNSDGLLDQANWVFRTPILRKNYLNNKNSSFEFDLFVEDLKLLRKQIPDSGDNRFNEKTKLLLLVDESQYIYSKLNIIEDVRYVIQHHDLGVGFVFAGDSTFISSYWESVFGGSHREFEIIALNYFVDNQAVVDYFVKSLDSIGWTSEEIETKLFYRFKHACRQIFQLTSGKPSWINTIASKMFERCMLGESTELRFDREAQSEVKKLLEDSGQIDKSKLDYIDNLPFKYQKWLAALFASELNTFDQVYFYTKFKLTGDDHLTGSEFLTFCEQLVTHGIIIPLREDDEDKSIGYRYKISDNLFKNKPYITFGLESDTIKQWLLINSDGKYGFGFEPPADRFVYFINSELVSEKRNVVLVRARLNLGEEDQFRFARIVEMINDGSFDVPHEPFEKIEAIYKFCKKLKESSERRSLYCTMKNMTSGRVRAWNVYNYDDKEKLIGFNDLPRKIQKFISTVEEYKSESHNYLLEIFIDSISRPNMEKFQHLIMDTKDVKKIGIILDDKMDDLLRYYLKDSDIETSYLTALFFYELFEAGHDLKIRELNNAAYVFIAKSEFDKASNLLHEAKSQIQNEFDDPCTACLSLYNLAIIDIHKGEYLKGLSGFKSALSYYQSKLNIEESAIGVLNILNLDENGKILVQEIREGDPKYPRISIKSLVEHNIEIIESSCLNPAENRENA